jgi:tetratricopeptide (TPR) repeat protein
MRLVSVTAMALALAACAAPPLQSDGPSVGEVVQQLPGDVTAVAAPDRIQTGTAVDAYRRVEDTLPDAADNRSIYRRIADLDRRLGTETGGDGAARSYHDAIARYQQLLDTPGVQRRDEVLYHLAESYELLGDDASSKRYLDRLIDEQPDSDHRIEAHFRRAEIAFSAGDYDAAAADYQYIVAQGGTSNLWLNADYMLGWTYLKQGDYATSLDRFLRCIDTMLAAGVELDTGTQEMLDDTLRAIVLDVGNLDGPTTLADHLDAMRKPAWQYRAYQRLADDWRSKQRYLDSVAALETFVTRNPYDARAPQFSVREIDTLIEAQFPDEVRQHKRAFLARYRFDGDYWTVNGAAARVQIAPVYKTYLMEVAKLTHADAQQNHDAAMFVDAAAYYRQYADTFPDDAAAGEALFLQGEALTEAHQAEQAVAAYQQVVHRYPADVHAPDAAYAAILGLAQLLHDAPEERAGLVQRSKIDAQIEYATLFPSAQHAAEVQADAADQLFTLHEFADAGRLAEGLLARHDLTPPLQRVATLILAQIAFEESRYDVAEARYRDVVALSSGSAIQQIMPRLLASIYKQAEAAEARGDVDTAIHDYLRIADEDPHNVLAAKGHFDAVAVSEAAERWSTAADLLHEFQMRYPNDPLASDSDTRLADLYEKANRTHDAADTLRRVAAANARQEEGRQALFHAGELYATVDVPRAIDSFASYQQEYPDPADLALEAVQQLDQLNQRTGNAPARVQWLHRKIEIAAGMGDAMTDRARYLAAAAQFELAQQSRRSFDAIDLSGNLGGTLTAKRAALKETVAAFEQSASYGVDEFATGSTFEIADTYAALAHALLDSTRPSGLTDLEREQYDVLLEEQATPFEEQAIAIHEINAQRISAGVYDEWTVKSLAALRELVPARYDRTEVEIGFIESIR